MPAFVTGIAAQTQRIRRRQTQPAWHTPEWHPCWRCHVATHRNAGSVAQRPDKHVLHCVLSSQYDRNKDGFLEGMEVARRAAEVSNTHQQSVVSMHDHTRFALVTGVVRWITALWYDSYRMSKDKMTAARVTVAGLI
jgi:hypothetical protein